MLIRRLPLVAALLVPLTICAQEGTAHHLRLEIQRMPTDFDIEARDSSGVVESGPGSYSNFSRLRLGYLAGIPLSQDAAFLIGTNLALSSLGSKAGGDDISQEGLGVEIGVAATPSSRFAFELVVQGGFGLSSSSSADSGHYGEFGFAGRPVLSFGAFEVFAEIGLFWQKQKLDYATVNVDSKTAGGQAGLGVGWVF